MSKFIISIDPAIKNTGVSIFMDGAIVKTTTIHTKTSTDEYKRLAYLYRELTKFITPYLSYAYDGVRPTVLCEDGFNASKWSSQLDRVRGVCMMVAGICAENFVLIHPKKWRSFLHVQNGKKPSLEMIEDKINGAGRCETQDEIDSVCFIYYFLNN